MVPVFDRVLPLKILLADDHLVNQKIVLMLLKRLGYQADVVGNGLEVLAALQSQRYDVVLLDVQMPEMDGLEVARWICQSGQLHYRPYLITITANVTPDERQKCFRAGMDACLSKPIRLQALDQVLSQCKPLPRSIASIAADVASDWVASDWVASDLRESPSSRTTCSPHAVLDVAALTDFRQEMGETADAVIAELITSYLAEAPRLLQTLHRAISEGDVKTVQRVAHGLKASSAALGAIALSQRCRELEAIALHASIEQITPMLACLKFEYACVEAALSQTQSYPTL